MNNLVCLPEQESNLVKIQQNRSKLEAVSISFPATGGATLEGYRKGIFSCSLRTPGESPAANMRSFEDDKLVDLLIQFRIYQVKQLEDT